MLRLYQDSSFIVMTSRRGRFSFADKVTGSGDYPQTVEEAFYIATEQSTIDGAMDDSQKIINLDYPRFTSTPHPLVRIGNEVMLITDGWGTTTLTVTRAQESTSAAAHADEAVCYAAYQVLAGTLIAIDTAGGSKDDWVTYKPDGGSYASTQRLVVQNYDGSAKYWRKIIIPTGTTAEQSDDLVDRIQNVTLDQDVA